MTKIILSKLEHPRTVERVASHCAANTSLNLLRRGFRNVLEAPGGGAVKADWGQQPLS